MSVLFLANPGSPHVRQWQEIIDGHMTVKTVCHPAHWRDGESGLVGGAAGLRKLLARLPGILGYVWLGLWLRFRLRDGELLHAHNTSGYGFAAWLSGRRYLVTTYGTEIFSGPGKSALYNWLIRRILHGAESVTATSAAMEAMLVDHYGVPASRIHMFSLGVSATFTDTAPPSAGRPLVWFNNRRIHPHYQTLEVCQAFQAYAEQHDEGELWLLEGDAEAAYLNSVREWLAASPVSDRIRLLSGFVAQRQLCDWLDQARFVLSVPLSDQLSSSILEGLARGAVPLLRPLDAYQVLADVALFLPADRDLVPALSQAFIDTAALPESRWQALSQSGQQAARDHYSLASAWNRYRIMLADAGVQE